MMQYTQRRGPRLYLAGPITGVPDYKERFAEAEADFSEHYDVINPARILEGVDDRDCLPLCLRLIDRSDSVVLLPGWRSSMGAVTEALYAVRQGKAVTAYERKDAASSVCWDGEKLTTGSDEKTRKWIPCSEQLPQNDEYVLCCTRRKNGTRGIVIGYYLREAERWACGMNSNVVAWMPLPEPYKED